MRIVALAVLCGTALTACRKQDRHPAPPAAAMVPPAAATGTPTPTAVVAPPEKTLLLKLARVAPADLPPGALTVGKLHAAFTWRDADGDNLAVLAKIDVPSDQSEFIRVDHFLRDRGTGDLTTLRTVRDGGQCLDDGGVDYRDDAVGLTDLDSDGFGELTFAYRLICVTDVSPGDVKLLLLEHGDKFILRGGERMRDCATCTPSGGQFTPGTEFNIAPAGFLEHAHSIWERIIDRVPR